jgi:hypothetical protein
MSKAWNQLAWQDGGGINMPWAQIEGPVPYSTDVVPANISQVNRLP